MATFLKDPDAELDYSVDWSNWLAEGDTVTLSEWAVPTGLTKGAESLGQGVATVWLSGGTAGERYNVTNTVTTAAGRVDERTITILVRER